MYKKKGEAGVVLEAAKNETSPLRWYVKPASSRGPSSTVCFAYVGIKESNKRLPQDISEEWTINTSEGFKAQSSIKVKLASNLQVPKSLLDLCGDDTGN